MFSVSCYSQFLDVEDVSWRKKSCGIVALKMILDYWNVRMSACDALIKEGIKSRAYMKDVGWTHKGLVALAKKYNLKGRNFDWFGNSPEAAFRKMEKYLRLYPIMASVHKDFDLRNNGHLIVLTGLVNSNIFYNDPDFKERENIRQKVSLGKFLKGWKRRIIVVYPKDY